MDRDQAQRIASLDSARSVVCTYTEREQASQSFLQEKKIRQESRVSIALNAICCFGVDDHSI